MSLSWNSKEEIVFFFYFLFQGQITLMDVPVFKAIQPDVSTFKELFF